MPTRQLFAPQINSLESERKAKNEENKSSIKKSVESNNIALISSEHTRIPLDRSILLFFSILTIPCHVSVVFEITNVCSQLPENDTYKKPKLF